MMNYKDDIPTKQIREDLKVLMTKIVEWDLDKDGYGVASVMLASFELKKGTGRLEWEFSKKLLNKLTSDGYTPLKLSIVLDLVGKYALALYENLQMRKSFLKTSFNLQEFRALMGVEKDEHPRMEAFKRKVLHPAIDEINKKGDMKVSYKDRKEGAKIIGFDFAWSNLTNDQIRERNKQRELIEYYQKHLAANFKMRFLIAGKWYTLTKETALSIAERLLAVMILSIVTNGIKHKEAHGFVTEKKGHAQPPLLIRSCVKSSL